jgi:hypothetical protein
MKKERSARDEITIIGFVDPLDDNDDNSGVMISTENDEYIVEMNQSGERLLNLIDEEVQVTGRLSLAEDGTKSIAVTHFDNVPYDGEDEDDD